MTKVIEVRPFEGDIGTVLSGGGVRPPKVERIDRSKMMRYERMSPPRCEGVVGDATYRWRYKSGRDDKCERQSIYIVDGVNYCSLHAGAELVKRGVGGWK